MDNFLVWSKDGSNSIVQQSIQYSDNHSERKKESHCGKCDSGETISIMWIFSRSIQEGESCSAATQHILTQELHGSNPAKHLLVNKVLLEHSHVHL